MTSILSITDNNDQPVGVVGLGLLGRGITTCLLANGFKVHACDITERCRDDARKHIDDALKELAQKTGYNNSSLTDWEERYNDFASAAELSGCKFVIESVTEELDIKRQVFDELESCLNEDTPIASNTSAIPISTLQQGRKNPTRFVGMHWGEPAHILRFVEIIRGEHTSDKAFDDTVQLAEALGKEPSLVQKDIRGFITNRLMYAMMREAFYLLENDVADVETIDRAFRNDIGWWATMAGPFRWMDLTGIPAYQKIMKELLPQLCNSTEVPETLKKLVDSGAKGMENYQGFYKYDKKSASQWQKTWTDFTWDIKALADKHVPTARNNTDKSKQNKS